MDLLGRLGYLQVSRVKRYGAGSGLQNPATASEIASEKLDGDPRCTPSPHGPQILKLVPESRAQTRLYDEISN